MASLYKRPRSPFWWVKFKDANGKVCYESTKIRFGSKQAWMEAEMIRRKKAAGEVLIPRNNKDGNAFTDWVERWISAKHHNNQQSFTTVLARWKVVRAYFTERKVFTPTDVRREHCYEFLMWRMKPHKEHGLRKASHNTALSEIKFINSMMIEAVRRGYTTTNPCSNLGIRKEDSREKPELNFEDIELIRANIPKVKDKEKRHFLHVSFEIGLHQGCRLSETYLPLSAFDLVRMELNYPRLKGKPKGNVSPLNPKLVPLVEQLIAEGRETTYTKRAHPSYAWFGFLKRIGLHQRGVCFHCLRVTFISNAARSGIPETHTMKIVHHASKEIHRIYQRTKMDDLHSAMTHIRLPG